MIFLKQNRTFGELAITEVFAYFDGPRLFLANNPAGQRYLVNSLDSDADNETWLLTAISETRLLRLAESLIDLRTAFVNPELDILYEVTTNAAQEIVSAKILNPSDLTDELLPEPRVFLEAKLVQESPNAAFLARSLNASVVLLHLFPNQSKRDASLKGIGKIFGSLQDYLELKLNRALQTHAKNVFSVELLGTFAGSLGVEIAVRGDDERIAPALKSAIDVLGSAHEPESFMDRMAVADSEEVSSVRKLMSSLRAVRSGLEIETASQKDPRVIRVEVDLPRVRDAVRALGRKPTNRNETRTVTGDLVALNLRTNKFEIVDFETEETIAGTLASPMFSEEQTAELPRRYRIVVEREVRSSVTGREETAGWKMISATKLF